MQLVEVDRFSQDELKSGAGGNMFFNLFLPGRKEVLVLGIAEASTDSIYFADTSNSKLKRLNIKTRHVDEVLLISVSLLTL